MIEKVVWHKGEIDAMSEKRSRVTVSLKGNVMMRVTRKKRDTLFRLDTILLEREDKTRASLEHPDRVMTMDLMTSNLPFVRL